MTLPLDLVVHGRRSVAEGIVELDLRAPDGAALPPFAPGAHIDLQAGPVLLRQYSLCNDPAETHRYVLAVLLERQGRGGSAAVHGFAVGDRLRAGAPRNNFALHTHAAPAVLVAGGIGITPLKAMMHALWREGRPFGVHYFARTRAHAAFLAELQGSPFAAALQFHFDDEGGALPLPATALRPAADAHVYICGPAGFIARVQQDALAAGVAPDAVHVEHFAAAPMAGAATDGGFTVQAARSGITVQVGPDQTIAQALEQAGVPVLTSCEQGICGACLTYVLDGVPDHRDDYLTDAEKAENARMTICCSRARSAVLTLDI